MPDVSTSRTRDVTIAGGGGFGLDSAAVFNPTYNIGAGDQHRRIAWFAGSEVSYWGKSVQVQLSWTDGWSSGAASTPRVTLTIFYGGFSKSVTVAGTSYTGGTFTAPAQQSLQYFDTSLGSYTFTEVVHCVQHVNPSPYEVRTGVSFTCSASISVAFVDTLGTGSQTISASLTMTDADIAGFASESYADYNYVFTFGGIGVHFDNSAVIGFDQPGLISAFSGANTTYGAPQLTGSGTGATFHWVGGTAALNPNWSSGAPSAALEFRPSWAISVASNIRHYKDGSEVGATINHYYGTDLVGSFASGSAYRYPASGLIDYVLLDSFDSGANNAGTGMQPGTLASYTLTGSNYGPIGLLFQKPGDPIGGTTTFRVDPDWANGYATYTPSLHPTPPPTTGSSGLAVKVMPPYQQGTIEFDSAHTFGLFENNTGPRWVAFGSGPTFPGVTAPWDASPAISLISGAGIDGNALQVQSAGPASAGAQLRYLLKHQGYRYAHLRVRASPPSTTLTAAVSASAADLPVASSAGFHNGDRVTLGAETLIVTSEPTAGHIPVSPLGIGHSGGATVARVGASRVLLSLAGSSAGTVAWLVTPPADGSWVTVDLDLARPQYKSNGLTWAATTDLVPPAAFYPDLVASASLGAQVAVLPLDAGTFAFDWLEGYRKTDGSRTPILFFPFLDGRGDPWGMTAYEDNDFGAWDTGPSKTYDQADLLRWVVNGVHGATLRGATFPTPDPADVAGVWTKLYNAFDTAANDTGISIVKGVAGDPDPLSVFGPLNQGQYAFDLLSGYGLKPAADAALVVHGQLREFPVDAEAYYGAGDIMSASGGYGAVITFTVDWVFDGEAIINTPAGGAGVTLNDNDTGTALDTVSTDDDGMARLHAKYGVVYTYNNLTGAAEWSRPPPPSVSTTLTAFVFGGDTVIHVASAAGFSVGDEITVGFFGAYDGHITAISGLDFTISPPSGVSGGIPSGNPVTLVPATPPIIYTAEGLLLNSDWLSGDVSPTDSGGYLTTGSPPVREDIVILDRYQTFVTVEAAGFLGLANLETHLGRYFVAWPDTAAGIRVSRSDFTTPPFAAAATDILATTDPADREPCLMIRPGGSPYEPERLRLLYGRGGQVYARESDDGGETWSDEMGITGGKHPRGVYGAAKERVEAAVVGSNIQGTVQYPGDAAPSSPVTFVDPAGVALSVENDTFDLDDAKEGEERLVMIVRIQGESAPSSWASAAYDYSTWERVS